MSRACRRSPDRKAFSLLEAVITLLLVSIVFGVAADLLGDACRVMSFSRAKSNSVQAVQMALTRMAAEAREAFKIDRTGTELVLLKIDPGGDRFPTTPPAAWSPYTYQVSVRYFPQGGQLWREVDGANTQLVADGITGLATRNLPGQALEISLTLLEDRIVRTLTTQVRTLGVAP